MRSLAAFCFDRHRLVIGLWVAAVLAAAALAAGAGGGFVNDFALPGTESQRAVDLLKARFPAQSGDASQIVFRADRGTLRDPAARARVERVLARVRPLPSVAGVQSPFAARGQISRDGRTAFATLNFDALASKLDRAEVERVVSVARGGAGDGVQVNLGGQAIEFAQQPKQSATEGVGVIVAIVVLLLVLGSLAAMAIPLIVAFAAIAVGVALVAAASAAVNIADFAPTLATMIALGVGIDYALLVISRFRGERARGSELREATLAAMDTAGRSVLFAGTTVVIALLGMLTLGIGLLNGPAVASALAVGLTMAGSLTLLPALLGSRLGRRVTPTRPGGADRGRWAAWSALVERRPRLLGAAALLLLLLVAMPALGMRLGVADAGNDTPGKTTRIAYDQLSEGFGPGFNGPLLVVAETRPGSGPALARLRQALRRERGVVAVTAPVSSPRRDAAVLTLFPSSKPQDAATKDLLTRLRERAVPPVESSTGLAVSIGGATATSVDLSATLADKLPLFILIVVGLSLLLLAIVFRSLLLPLKAGVMNVLSIGAALGVITWVFQHGHLASLLGVQTTGPIEAFLPVFLFAIVFGLSMDYEVFLVTRMHEEWEHGADAHAAVRRGLALTGKVVMAAALIMISVFGSFLLGEDRTIKLFGLGLASAVLFDAFVIRLVLVPALMHLFGNASWWMPSALERRLPRISIEGPPDAPARAQS